MGEGQCAPTSAPQSPSLRGWRGLEVSCEGPLHTVLLVTCDALIWSTLRMVTEPSILLAPQVCLCPAHTPVKNSSLNSPPVTQLEHIGFSCWDSDAVCNISLVETANSSLYI